MLSFSCAATPKSDVWVTEQFVFLIIISYFISKFLNGSKFTHGWDVPVTALCSFGVVTPSSDRDWPETVLVTLCQHSMFPISILISLIDYIIQLFGCTLAAVYKLSLHVTTNVYVKRFASEIYIDITIITFIWHLR